MRRPCLLRLDNLALLQIDAGIGVTPGVMSPTRPDVVSGSSMMRLFFLHCDMRNVRQKRTSVTGESLSLSWPASISGGRALPFREHEAQTAAVRIYRDRSRLSRYLCRLQSKIPSLLPQSDPLPLDVATLEKTRLRSGIRNPWLDIRLNR